MECEELSLRCRLNRFGKIRVYDAHATNLGKTTLGEKFLKWFCM